MARKLLFVILALCSAAWGQNVYTISNDDALTGWTTFYDPAGSGHGTGTQTFNNASPALDGGSMLLSVTGNSFTNVGFYRYAGIHDTLNYLTLDLKFYVPTLTNVQALEFDPFQYIHTGAQVSLNTRFYPGTECVTSGNHWDIWDSLAAHWVNTGVPCTVTAGVWHHLNITVHRVAGDTSCSGYPCMHYDWIILDGTYVVVGQTTSAGPLPAPGGVLWGEQSGFMIQVDTNGACGPSCTISESIDELNFTLSTGAVYPSALLGDDAYCSGGVPNFTNDGPAQGLQACNYTPRSTSPSNGATWTVNVSADLQPALNSSACGDNVVVTAGAILQGNYTIPAKACDSAHWLTIKTSAMANLPPEGTRVTPCYFGVASLPGRPFTCSSTTKYGATIESLGRGNTHALTFAAGVHYVRLEGLEITSDPTGVFGDQPVLGDMIMSNGNLDHIVIDQSWCHGYAGTETEYCTILSGVSTTTPTTYISFVDSFLSDFHCVAVVGLCGDAYAIGYGMSQGVEGPYKFVNNFIEASAENLFSGGSPATTVPSDVEVRLNYFFKPQIWNPSSPNYNGGLGGHPFVVKNILENKNVNRELIEGNYLQNSWAGFSQAGEAITLTPKNIGTCSVCEVVNVIFRYNAGNNVAAPYQIANTNATGTSFYSFAGNSYSIHDNVWDDIGDPLTCGGNSLTVCVANPAGIAQTLNTNPANNVTTNIFHDLYINHETWVMSATPAVNPASAFYVDGPNGATQTNFTLTNSIFSSGTYGVTAGYSGVGTHCGYGQGMTNLPSWLNLCWNGWSLTNNAIVGGGHTGWRWSDNGGVTFPATYANIGFANYNGGNGGDYRLCSGVASPVLSCVGFSPYLNAATDGLNIGANVAAVLPLMTFAMGPVPSPPPPLGFGTAVSSGNAIYFGVQVK